MNSPSSSNAAPLQLHARLQRPGFLLDVDMQLPAQGITALFGPSGSGKTTCLRALAGLEPAATGHVSVAGEVWQDSATRVFRPVHQRALGYVFQEASLLAHLSVEGNLKFGFQRTPLAQRRYNWDQGLALLGISHLLPRMPHELSGGERQRVAIARALATSPRVLLMDEPLAALDAARKADILPWLERLHRELDIPVIYVSHALDEVARLADYLVLLEAGRVVGHGPTAELLTRLDLSLAHGDSASAMLACTVQGHDPADHLMVTTFGDATLLLPWHEATPGQVLRVRVQARDVSLTLQHQQDTSILNILSATVTAITPDSPGQMMVALQASGSALLARVTERSARALGLHPGQAVFAQVKGVAILG
jgi:molybdate transport system ATP-binding protein